MTKEAIYEKTVEVLSDKLALEPSEVTAEATLVDDLGASSLELIDMVMTFEKETGITIDPQKLYDVKTVQDIVDLMYHQQSAADTTQQPSAKV